MASVADTFLEKNAEYVAKFDKHNLPMPPAKHLAVITCMDARLDPQAHLGIGLGEAHIIRNAGGVARDAIRNIVISQRYLNTREIAVFHHTDCGMLYVKGSEAKDKVKDAAPGDANIAKLVDEIDFLEFNSVEDSVRDDVEFLKNYPLILKETKITGWVYEIETGKVRQVV
jgi:carbonic anhydrase